MEYRAEDTRAVVIKRDTRLASDLIMGKPRLTPKYDLPNFLKIPSLFRLKYFCSARLLPRVCDRDPTMSLYSDDRRKRKWDNQDSSPSKSRSSGRDYEDRSRDRGDGDRHESRYEERRGSSQTGYNREGDTRDRRDRRSASPVSRDPAKKSSSSRNGPNDPAAAAGFYFLLFQCLTFSRRCSKDFS
jgi:hypothetical protein